jgi:hypothetical protein
MAANLTRLTHRIAIQLHLVAQRAALFAVLVPDGQSGNFWIQPRTLYYVMLRVPHQLWGYFHAVICFNTMIGISSCGLLQFHAPSSSNLLNAPPPPETTNCHRLKLTEIFRPNSRTEIIKINSDYSYYYYYYYYYSTEPSLEELTVTHIAKKSPPPTFYGTRRFITVFTKGHFCKSRSLGNIS